MTDTDSDEIIYRVHYSKIVKGKSIEMKFADMSQREWICFKIAMKNAIKFGDSYGHVYEEK